MNTTLAKDLLEIEDDLKSIDTSGTRVNEELGAAIAKLVRLRKFYNEIPSQLAVHEYDTDPPIL